MLILIPIHHHTKYLHFRSVHHNHEVTLRIIGYVASGLSNLKKTCHTNRRTISGRLLSKLILNQLLSTTDEAKLGRNRCPN